MDGPGPIDVFEQLAAAVTDARGTEALKEVIKAVTASRRAAPDAGIYRSVGVAIKVLLGATQDLSASDQLFVEATAQWAKFGRLSLAENVNWDTGSDTEPSEFRDRCIALNLNVQRQIHQPNTTIFTAHNGHVSRVPSMAGGHLAGSSQFDYLAVGFAFGLGSYNAGTAREEGGFDPKLTVFEAEPPPVGTMEWVLQQVGIASFAIDLRPFRRTDHVFAREMTLREVSLAGGAPQFSLRRVPAETYDILVWFDQITPSSILRGEGDFW
jgi:erythromycin esterase-like protein